MARPPDIQSITRDTIPDAPSWLEKLLRPLNGFIGATTRALARGLTFADNFSAVTKTLKVEMPAYTPPAFPEGGQWPLRVACVGDNGAALAARPRLLWVASARDLDTGLSVPAPAPAWEPATEAGAAAVLLRHLQGLEAGHRYEVTLIIATA